MRLEVIDFPSDPRCELPKNSREILTKMLHRAAESKDACDKVEATLIFAVQKLKECKAGHAPVKVYEKAVK